MKYKVNLDEIKKAKSENDKNFSERLQFIKFWAEYVKTHPDKEWSRQQNRLIDSQIQNTKQIKLNREDYLKMKKEQI